MKCEDCYYWYRDVRENGDAYGNPYCHYCYNDGYAPCEIDDNYETEDADD